MPELREIFYESDVPLAEIEELFSQLQALLEVEDV